MRTLGVGALPLARHAIPTALGLPACCALPLLAAHPRALALARPAAAAEGDLQLAWENLDTAKVIWGRDPAAHAQQLADVHGLLGDVAMESDDFETALVELEAALGHLVTVVQVGVAGRGG